MHQTHASINSSLAEVEIEVPFRSIGYHIWYLAGKGTCVILLALEGYADPAPHVAPVVLMMLVQTR